MAVVACVSIPHLAFAQYAGVGGGSGQTLEESLKLAHERVAEVQTHPGAGSGTPFLAANGMITALGVVTAIFGTIFGIFVYMGKKAEAAKKALR